MDEEHGRIYQYSPQQGWVWFSLWPGDGAELGESQWCEQSWGGWQCARELGSYMAEPLYFTYILRRPQEQAVKDMQPKVPQLPPGSCISQPRSCGSGVPSLPALWSVCN